MSEQRTTTATVTMHDGRPYDIEVKRFSVPATVESKCPKCGVVSITDYDNDRYLMYPVANKPFNETLYCSNCETEWEVRLLLTCKLEAVP